MDKKMNFKYFYGTEADQFSFTEYPKLYLPMTVSRIFPVMRRSYTV